MPPAFAVKKPTHRKGLAGVNKLTQGMNTKESNIFTLQYPGVMERFLANGGNRDALAGNIQLAMRKPCLTAKKAFAVLTTVRHLSQPSSRSDTIFVTRPVQFEVIGRNGDTKVITREEWVQVF